VLIFIGATAAEWAVEALLNFHNDFMRKYRQAQKEGRL
jgi:hypothetical protein